MSMSGGEKLFLAAAAAAVAWASVQACTGTARPYASGGQRPDARGCGDDQYDEGFGIDLALTVGACQPDDHTRWHYGGGMPGQALPTNWQRHRLAYPRRQGDGVAALISMPLNHPAFPCNTAAAKWFYDPPADEDL